MRKLPGLVFLAVCSVVYLTPFAPLAWAGETLMGTINVTDGGTATNRTTGYVAYACPANATGGCFEIGTNNKITVQCDQACFIGANVSGCDAGQCLKVAADEKFPTSVSSQALTLTGRAFNSDGGTAGVAVTYTGGWFAASPVSGAACVCKVFLRSGTE